MKCRQCILRYLSVFIALCGLWTAGLGQKSYSIYLEKELISTHQDTFELAEAAKRLITQWKSEGHILAQVDSLSSNKDVKAYLYKGEKYRYGTIQVRPEDNLYISAAGLRRYDWKTKQVHAQTQSEYMESILTYMEDNGYPFAAVGLDSVSIVDGVVDAQLALDKGSFVVWDSLVVHGDVEITQGYLRRYLEIPYDKPFDRSIYQVIEKRLREIPFAEQTKRPVLRLYKNRAVLHIFLKKKRSSRFDFLIGILPSTVDGQQRFTISGSFSGELYNRLGYGEYMYANFERLRPESQQLELKGSYPFLAGGPVGLYGGLKLYQREADFFQVDSDLGMSYQLGGDRELIASFNTKSARLQDIDGDAILARRRLPSSLDNSYIGAKLGLRYNKTDYRYNPSQGYSAHIDVSLGQKSIIVNNTIVQLSTPEVDFQQAYDSLQLKTTQVTTELRLHHYTPVGGIFTLASAIRSGLIINPEQVFENEFYRVGGNKLLRGFDEQAISAQSYILATLEARLILNRNSYLTLPFFDYGYTQVMDEENNLDWDRVMGTGLGINFATPAGIFNVAFAAGSRLGNPLDFRNTKVHFGYLSLF